jgi:hypothetical protein
MTDNSNQIVYVLTNPAMPGLVKIGKTTQQEVEERMKQLYGTGVPVPFECAFACQVSDAKKVEDALHFAFGETRINSNREFFRIEPERVIRVLELLNVDNITQQVEKTIEDDTLPIDKQASEALKTRRRPNLNFFDLGIPSGAILVSVDGNHQATVAGEKRVNFQGTDYSFTEATRQMLGLDPGYAIQPSPYWTFNGRTLKELYDEFYASDEV